MKFLHALLLSVALIVPASAADYSGGGGTATPSANSTLAPSDATPIFFTGTGTTAAIVVTMTAVSGKTNYLCGFSYDVEATAAAFGSMTVTGLLGGTFNGDLLVGQANAITNYKQSFAPCLPASAVNTAIVLTTGAPGSGGVGAVNAWGYVR